MSSQNLRSAPANKGGSDTRLLIVVRTKSSANLPSDVRRTLAQLNLLRVFSASLVPSSPDYLGMLRTAKDVVCWGEIDETLLGKLLSKRGRLVGNRRLTDENLRLFSDIESVRELTDAVYSRKLQLKDVKSLKPFFRLSPPKGGFKGSKKKANLGYLGTRVNELVARML